MPEFYAHGQAEFAPQYADVDWRQRLLARLAVEGSDDVPSLRFKTNDGLDMEITQENCTAFINLVDDDCDAIAVTDPRDNLNFLHFRFEIGEEGFDQILGAIMVFGTLIQSRYPRQDIAELYINRKQGDLSQLDEGVPDGWA